MRTVIGMMGEIFEELYKHPNMKNIENMTPEELMKTTGKDRELVLILLRFSMEVHKLNARLIDEY